MEYDDPNEGNELAERVRSFMNESVIPLERDLLGERSITTAELESLREEARQRGIFAPQLSEQWAGGGYSFREVLPAFEVAGRSLLGPAAMRMDAPDEGNMHLLQRIGTDDQRSRWLRALVSGDISSAFAMTEPMNGAGSDPKMIRTTATRDGDDWIINGHKWWTTNGVQADLFIVLARTDPDTHPYEGCSLFLIPDERPGIERVRAIPHLGPDVIDTDHAEIRFENVRISRENLLGQQGKGFQHAQTRLGPARLTHCMRFTGMAERALDVAEAYATERIAFGDPLAEKQSIRFAIADLRTRLHAVRCMVRDAGDRIAAGDQARVPISMTKLFAAGVVQDAVDRAVQICGASGIGKDLPLADFYEAVRSFRIVDGADEVHRRVIARDTFDSVSMAELDALPRYGQ